MKNKYKIAITLVLSLILLSFTQTRKNLNNLPVLGTDSNTIIENYHIFDYTASYQDSELISIVKDGNVFKFSNDKLVYFLLAISKDEMLEYKRTLEMSTTEKVKGRYSSGYIVKNKDGYQLYYLQDVEVENHLNYYISSSSCNK